MKAETKWPVTTDDISASLRRAIDSKEHELTSLRNALAWLDTAAPSAEQEKPERKAAKKPGRKPKVEHTPKKSKKAAKVAKASRSTADDEPRARKGHVPKVGVQQCYCSELGERQAKCGALKAEGYRRIGPGEPLSAGTYDVRPSGDEDESCVVLWRAPVAEVDGE